MRRLLIATLLALPTLASAQPAAPAPAAVAAPEPARLAAARQLIEATLPAGKRDTMMRDMMAPLMANMRQAMEQSPEIAAALGNDPEARALLTRFLDQQMASTMALTTKSLPALMDAMAIAYARRFTVDQLREVSAFYATPTGRAFIDQMPQIMADPAVQVAQREMMTDAIGHMRESVGTFTAEMAALEKKRKAAK